MQSSCRTWHCEGWPDTWLVLTLVVFIYLRFPRNSHELLPRTEKNVKLFSGQRLVDMVTPFRRTAWTRSCRVRWQIQQMNWWGKLLLVRLGVFFCALLRSRSPCWAALQPPTVRPVTTWGGDPYSCALWLPRLPCLFTSLQLCALRDRLKIVQVFRGWTGLFEYKARAGAILNDRGPTSWKSDATMGAVTTKNCSNKYTNRN